MRWLAVPVCVLVLAAAGSTRPGPEAWWLQPQPIGDQILTQAVLVDDGCDYPAEACYSYGHAESNKVARKFCTPDNLRHLARVFHTKAKAKAVARAFAAYESRSVYRACLREFRS